MNTGRTIFAQLMDLVPLPEFRRCVERYRGDYKSRSFSALDQFLCLAFAQLTYRESLRDIEACLRGQPANLYHMGIRGRVSRYPRLCQRISRLDAPRDTGSTSSRGGPCAPDRRWSDWV